MSVDYRRSYDNNINESGDVFTTDIRKGGRVVVGEEVRQSKKTFVLVE